MIVHSFFDAKFSYFPFLSVALVAVSIVVSIPKLLSDKIKKTVGPAILSFMMMLSTGLSLHQKPLICG